MTSASFGVPQIEFIPIPVDPQTPNMMTQDMDPATAGNGATIESVSDATEWQHLNGLLKAFPLGKVPVEWNS